MMPNGDYYPLRLTTAQDVADLVADLKAALKRSQRSGGEYGVYRKDADGRLVLAVEIHVE